MRFDHVGVLVDDLEAAKAFARDVLGLGEPAREVDLPDAGLAAAFFGLGDDLLVAPALDPGRRERKLWLPPGRWVDWWRSIRYHPATRRFSLRRHPRILRGPRVVTLPAPLGYPPLLLRAARRLRLLHPSVTSLYAPHTRRTYTVGLKRARL